MSAPATPAPASGGGLKKKLILVAVLGLIAGAVVPMVMGKGGDEKADADKKHGKGKSAKDKAKEEKTVTVSFGDVVVNLAEDRMTRYLRAKIVLSLAMETEEKATEHLAKHKAAMKNWLIGHVAGKTLKEVAGTIGVKRLQREILEHFEEMLELEEPHHLIDVLFEEYVVQ